MIAILLSVLSFVGCSGKENSKQAGEGNTHQKTEMEKEPEGFKSIHQRDYEKYNKDTVKVKQQKKKKETIRFN